METPLSTRRVTRSMAAASASAGNTNNNNLILSKKLEESEMAARQKSGKHLSKNQDRSVLVDITNNSPIVGLAMGSLETPSSAMSKKRGQCARTPGSGEALLRGQVKSLLQKVEEEAEVSKMAFEDRPFFNLQGLIRSPANLIAAPTPANTPQVLNFSDDLSTLTASPVSEKLLIPQMINEVKAEEGENLITRSLMLDFSEKSTDSCSETLSYEGSEQSSKDKSSMDDDNASIWSIQVNLSSSPRNDYGGDEDGGEEDEEGVDELCEGMSKIRVAEEDNNNKLLFMGKHIRFLYDSDDELRGQEEVVDDDDDDEIDGVVRLKGLPTPKGKHLRFPQESDSC
ncbi:uncharacterized protein LOC127248702 [Andrographis paniculata]|uniref:uncharacterized protein LOC127248702 n=1 Tax=Andrographis paniculata TaxID=175694 RepID=UPI0021E7038B|nr:uncharacterized protein LOC127248702 [Andrographis paniculata]